MAEAVRSPFLPRKKTDSPTSTREENSERMEDDPDKLKKEFQEKFKRDINQSLNKQIALNGGKEKEKGKEVDEKKKDKKDKHKDAEGKEKKREKKEKEKADKEHKKDEKNKKKEELEKKEEKKKKKEQFKDASQKKSSPDPGISTPFNVQHKVHVDFDYKWSGQNPDEVFELSQKLGEG